MFIVYFQTTIIFLKQAGTLDDFQVYRSDHILPYSIYIFILICIVLLRTKMCPFRNAYKQRCHCSRNLWMYFVLLADVFPGLKLCNHYLFIFVHMYYGSVIEPRS